MGLDAVGAAGDGDVVLLCGGGRVAIVAPATAVGAAFGCGVVVAGGGGGRGAVALHDRVQLDRRRVLSEVKHAWFLQAPEAL